MMDLSNADEWELRFCLNRDCEIGSWMVAQSRTHHEMWLVAQHQHASPYTVAGNVPVCRCCGSDLMTIAEFEGGIGTALVNEQGPVFDFLRQL